MEAEIYRISEEQKSARELVADGLKQRDEVAKSSALLKDEATRLQRELGSLQRKLVDKTRVEEDSLRREHESRALQVQPSQLFQ